uniref:Uncharacterized protein n=1 Tax=Strongyloides venezuelensis TaxID=75913 RepID=A0A0K0FCA3_STRVS
MNKFLFAYFLLISLITQSICQGLSFSVKQINSPSGTKYIYGGKQYNSLEEVKDEISKQNSGINLVTQVVPRATINYGGFGSRYPSRENNVYNGNSRYNPSPYGTNNMLNNGGGYNPYSKPSSNDIGGNYGGYHLSSSNNKIPIII